MIRFLGGPLREVVAGNPQLETGTKTSRIPTGKFRIPTGTGREQAPALSRLETVRIRSWEFPAGISKREVELRGAELKRTRGNRAGPLGLAH